MLNEENLISTLEQSLRQFQNAESRLQERLRKVEAEAEDLKIEIAALQNSAEKTEEALHSLIPTMRSGSKMWKAHKKSQEEDGDYQRKSRYEEDDYQKKPRYEQEGYQRKPRYEEDDYEMPPRRYSSPNANNQPPPDHRNNSAPYSNNQNNVAPINRNFESRDNRFTERTITQSCAMILRESNSALHVNELYNLLVAGGFKFTGNNPTISIAVSLNRNRRFSKVAPGTFDLVMREASKAS